jgi:hypothetical protein
VSSVRAILFLVAFSSVASADSWTEVGLVRSRLDMGGGHEVDAYSVRFAPRVHLRDGFYGGLELDGGRISGDVGVPPAYRSTGTETGPTTAVNGEAYSIGALLGMRVRAGSISGGGELVAGFHRADLRDVNGLEVAWINGDETMIEGRARLDVWLTPTLTVGGVVGVELDQPRDLSAGLMLGVHFSPYDGQR